MNDLNEEELEELKGKLKKIQDEYPDTEFSVWKQVLKYVLGFFALFAAVALGKAAVRLLF